HISLFFFPCHGDHRDLHSFPTRRSSDLQPSIAGAPGMVPASGFGGVEAIRRTDLPSSQATVPPPAARPQSAMRDPPSITPAWRLDRKSTRLNSSHLVISYAVFCLKKKKK